MRRSSASLHWANTKPRYLPTSLPQPTTTTTQAAHRLVTSTMVWVQPHAAIKHEKDIDSRLASHCWDVPCGTQSTLNQPPQNHTQTGFSIPVSSLLLVGTTIFTHQLLPAASSGLRLLIVAYIHPSPPSPSPCPHLRSHLNNAYGLRTT